LTWPSLRRCRLGQRAVALLVRRRRARRAVRDLARRYALPAPLGGVPAAYLRRLLAECRVRQRLQRLVQRRQLAGDAEEVLVVVETLVRLLQLVRDAVEPF